jgi:hypothetical protein
MELSHNKHKPIDAPKHDEGRLPWHLFPFDALEEVVKVYDFGKQKNYPEHSWRKGFHYSRIFSATCRHLFAWWRGEDKDVESGLSHLSHACWNVITLLDMTRRKSGTDDRLSLEKKEEMKLTQEEIQDAWKKLGGDEKNRRLSTQEVPIWYDSYRNLTTYSSVPAPPERFK